MSESTLRKFAFMIATVPFVAIGLGCDSTEVELKKEPLVQIPEPKAPEQQPKHLRPGRGSSAGITYDPSGVVPPP